MASLNEEKIKNDAQHVERASESVSRKDVILEDLDSIEQTQSGKFAWLVSVTAGVGGLLFGNL